MTPTFVIDHNPLTLADLRRFVFARERYSVIEISSPTRARIEKAHQSLQLLLEKRIPIYGVTTGFGHSCFRVLKPEQSAELQRNLVDYLSCGTGPIVPEEASRATLLIRLKSLSLGFSGVSQALLDRMALCLERGWTPVVPREGSLGASGDLIPLAYLAQIIQGQGMVHSAQGPVPIAPLLKAAKIAPYELKPKEGLALVNGTSTMAGLAMLNLLHARFLLELQTTGTAWLCQIVRGKTEAFGPLVNELAKQHPGQARIARRIRRVLEQETYLARRGQDVVIQESSQTDEQIQDRYSLRCTPQILGPVLETLEQAEKWLETEINGASDNPLIGDGGELEMGGNFYGGYLAQGMDYLKISLAHMADHLDRQLMLLFDERTSHGLPPNLANWPGLPEESRFLHHGLKGLHQAVNAITSEILPKSIPNGIFSRSSESHNQDKVSLGMSAAVQCSDLLEQSYTIQAMSLICLAQALDLRGIKPQGAAEKKLYETIRQVIAFVERDQPLGEPVRQLTQVLKTWAPHHEGSEELTTGGLR